MKEVRVLEAFGEPISHGGQESFVMNVLTHMDRTGMHIDLLTPYFCDNDYYRKLISQSDGKIYELGVIFAPGKSRINIFNKLNIFFEKHQYDVVHIHSGSISVLAIVSMVAKKNGVRKVITHSHCGIEHPTIKNYVLRHIAGISMRKNVDIYCACSMEAAKAKYIDSICKREVRILKNGVDLNKFCFNTNIRREIREKYKINETTILIGHVGRFNYQKNHKFIIDIFKEFHKKYSDSKLLLVGSGELEKNIRLQVQIEGLQSSVIFAGNVNNVNDFMQAVDFFVLPSHFEGLPIVGVEAQAAGLRIFASDKVSKEMSITKNVKYFPIESAPLWANAILQSINYERKDMRRLVKKSGFDINDTAEIIRRMYL